MWGLFLSFLQMFIGIPLEYIQPWWRVMIVFLAAHLFGIIMILATGIIDILTIAVVQGLCTFVLLFAYIPAFLLYWRELRYRWLYFSVFMGFFTFFGLVLLFASEQFGAIFSILFFISIFIYLRNKWKSAFEMR